MTRAMERLTIFLTLPLMALVLPLMAGCAGTDKTRLPTWAAPNPEVEARSYTRDDPFPDERAGPNTFTRPRAFIQPRTDTRKDYDLRYLKAAYGFQPRYSYRDNSVPVGTNSYPVQPLWGTPQQTAPIAAATTW